MLTGNFFSLLGFGMPGIGEWLVILFFIAAPVVLVFALVRYVRKRKDP